MKKIFLASLLLSLVFVATGALPAFAQEEGGGGPGEEGGGNLGVNIQITNPFRVGNTLYDFIETVVNNIILPIGGVLCVLAFIYAGFLYVTAQGNSTKITTAHNTLLYAVIGTAVLLGAWTIANVIRTTINSLT